MLHPSRRRFIGAWVFALLVMTFPVAILGPSHIGNPRPQLSTSPPSDPQDINGLVRNTIILRNGTVLTGNYAPTNGLTEIPSSIAHASQTNHLYVTSGESLITGNSLNMLYVIDGNTNGVITQIKLGAYPKGLAYDPTRRVMYVAGSQSILGISDDSLGVVANITLTTMEPWLTGVAYDPVNNNVYVADFRNSLVYAVNPVTGAVSNLAVAAGPMGIAYDSDSNRLYVNCMNYVSVIDAARNKVTANVTLNILPYPLRLSRPEAFQNIAYDSMNKQVYLVGVEGVVANPKSPPSERSGIEVGTVLTFDPSTNRVIGQVTPESHQLSTLAYNPKDNKLYVGSYEQSTRFTDQVTIIDGATNTALVNVKVGLGPTGIAYNAQNDELYVANARSDSVSAIAGANNSLVTTFRLQNYPVGVAYDPDNHLLYVADEGSYNAAGWKDSFSQTLLIVDPANPSVRTVDTGGIGPNMVAYNDYNKNIYVTNFIYGNVTVISGATNRVIAQVPMQPASGSFGIVYDPVNHDMYVSNQNSNTVSVIDSVSNTVRMNINAGTNPLGLAYDSKDNLIWVTHFNLLELSGPFVTAIDGSTNAVVANITMPGRTEPLGIIYNPLNNNLYVANNSGNNVTVIDGSTRSISGTIQLNPIRYAFPPIPGTLPQLPQNLVYDESHNLVYVTAQLTGELGLRNAREVWVIDPVTNTAIGNFTAGYAPTGGAFDSDNGYVYLSNYQSGTLSAVSADSLADFTVNLNPSVDFSTDSPGKATILVTGQAGFTGSVTLSANSTLGLTASLYPSSLSLSRNEPSKTTTLTMTGTRPGSYTIIVKGTSGDKSHSMQLAVTLNAGVTQAATILGLQPPIFYALVGVVAAGLAGTLGALIRRRSHRHAPGL